MSGSSYSDNVLVLHARPFQETSLVFECLGLQYGRYSLLARGVRKAGRGNKRSELQMTAQLNVEFRGKSELKTLTESEVLHSPAALRGDQYAVACYVSEVAMRVLQPQSVCSSVYYQVEKVFQNLRSGILDELALREFELSILGELGEGVDFELDADGKPFVADLYYRYRAQVGFEKIVQSDAPDVISGELLIKISAQEWEQPVLRFLKGLTRHLLSPHLGTKPLRSRELWRQWVQTKSVELPD